MDKELEARLRNYGLTRIARELNLNYRAPTSWIARGYVPAKHTWRVARLLGVKPEQINPELFTEQAS